MVLPGNIVGQLLAYTCHVEQTMPSAIKGKYSALALSDTRYLLGECRVCEA